MLSGGFAMSHLENKKKTRVSTPTSALLIFVVIALIVAILYVDRGMDDSAVALLGKWEAHDPESGWQTIEFLETRRFIIDGRPPTPVASIQEWKVEDGNILILQLNFVSSDRGTFYVSDDGDVLVLTFSARDIYFSRVR